LTARPLRSNGARRQAPSIQPARGSACRQAHAAGATEDAAGLQTGGHSARSTSGGAEVGLLLRKRASRAQIGGAGVILISLGAQRANRGEALAVGYLGLPILDGGRGRRGRVDMGRGADCVDVAELGIEPF
jgi:hypothetical protein